MGRVWAATLDPLFAGGDAVRLHANQRPALAVVGGLLFLIAAGLHYVVIAVQASQATERRAVELELLARRAELAALRAQINPHFMFNSLHSIATLTTTDASGPRRMCVLLADFLRDTLRTGRQNHITLDQELSLASQYLAIERVRFGSRLRVEVEAGAAVRACHVPPLLLQPVVENAVVHGVGQMLDGCTVTLSARRDGAVLVVTSTNPYDPTNPGRRGQGLGLVLLRKRLGTEFGARASVRTQALETPSSGSSCECRPS